MADLWYPLGSVLFVIGLVIWILWLAKPDRRLKDPGVFQDAEREERLRALRTFQADWSRPAPKGFKGDDHDR